MYIQHPEKNFNIFKSLIVKCNSLLLIDPHYNSKITARLSNIIQYSVETNNLIFTLYLNYYPDDDVTTINLVCGTMDNPEKQLKYISIFEYVFKNKDSFSNQDLKILNNAIILFNNEVSTQLNFTSIISYLYKNNKNEIIKDHDKFDINNFSFNYTYNIKYNKKIQYYFNLEKYNLSILTFKINTIKQNKKVINEIDLHSSLKVKYFLINVKFKNMLNSFLNDII